MCGDSDMKIAGAVVPEVEEPCAAEAVAEAQQNGNLDKARQLGARLAQTVAENGDAARRSLAAFAAVVGMDGALPAGPTAETARNAFYESLGGFYDEVRNAGTFSFYYLCLQKGDRVEQQVGATFAELCGAPEDTAMIAEGTALYQKVLEESAGLAAALAFR